ncbi:hypothetical protein [Amycolatopsis sp. GM8]|uniref:hypothetical protein n=1 Tax=Amycolatopsis sp. GM8 TaxID=2896530 RepID=UPI001F3460A1|nr:hypothetical protein [Amycolatopsis sp. GM8]
MNVEQAPGGTRILSAPESVPDSGLTRFPTVACSAPCPVCGDCRDDCAECVACAYDACPHCAVPDVTPRTAAMLLAAGVTLSGDLETLLFSSGRPVFVHHLLRAFGMMTSALEHGWRPVPRSLAEQLCLHLMIRYATDLSCEVGEILCANLPRSDYDYYFDRLYDTLLPDDRHETFAERVVRVCDGQRVFDFDGLTHSVSSAGSDTLFRSFR